MQTICRYSGLPIYKTPYLIGMELADIHPIFRAKRKLILNPEMIHKFAAAKAAEERKLIFLATLNATELVEFHAPAMPSDFLVQANFYKLQHTASWLAFAEHTYKQVVGFPQFVIRPDTADLSSLPAWIEACEDLKDQIIKRDINRERAAELTRKAEEIKAALGDAWAKHRAFTPALARWALEFAGFKKEKETELDKFNTWVKILCTPLEEVWVYDIDDLREIEAFLEENLPCEHPQVISVMAQIRMLITENKKGFNSFAIFTDKDPLGESFTIVEDDAEGNQVIRQSKHLQDVPTTEPQRKDYPTSTAFLLAQAKWKLSLAALERMTAASKKLPPPDKALTEESV